MTTPLTRRRHDAAHDRDVNIARIADALEALVDLATGLAPALDAVLDAVATMPVYTEPDEGDERTQDPGPDDAPASPEDATEWRPVKGGRAMLPRIAAPPVEVVVDRLYADRGVLLATVVSEDGRGATVLAGILGEPRS